ncbi:transmembrane protein 231 [Lepeophtheirus salmonis]|uniref:transmembrane protein 231 n=1 Tax=Lepeophtheirus salmonis TaxID=72036 RepID=UPI001AE2B3F1|nr:transmembrane protein 231-like [Lepeophtheirus salmonis]
MPTLYSHTLDISYKASICSKAFVFSFVTGVLTFLPPLFIAYRSQGFWQRIDSYQEQPEILFKQDCMFLLQTSNRTNLGWSTFKLFNRFLESGIRIPLIKTKENDWNRDGKLDNIDLQITFPLLPKEEILNFEAFLFFDVKLHKLPSVQFEGLIHLTSNLIDSKTKGIFYVGDFNLIQKEPLRHRGRDSRYNKPYLVDPISFSPDNYDFHRILRTYQTRNLTMRFENIYSSPIHKGKIDTFQIDVLVHFPEQVILYRPGFWQVLKWGWVQYLSVLLIFLMLFRTIKTFVFSKQILHSIQHNPFLKDKRN